VQAIRDKQALLLSKGTKKEKIHTATAESSCYGKSSAKEA
jgi:hypothetical protein